MYRAPSKRKKRTQLFFVYSLMITAVVAIVAVLVLVMLGYRFNRFDGKVEQGGLVQFDSRPSGASVTVDGTTLANRTASKITLTTGDHTITMAKDGYNTWTKDVTVKAGSILWLNYALMLPQQPTTTTVSDFSTVTSSLVSPDRKYLATIGAAADPTILIATLNADTPEVSKVVVDAASYTQPEADKPQSFSLVIWDKESRHALIRHTYNDAKTEYLWVDLRGQDATRNITTSLGTDIIKPEFSLADSNIMYVLTAAHDLRRINISSNTLSGPLVSNVAEFDQADRSTLTYTTLPDPDTKTRSIGYLTTGDDKPRVVRSTTEPETVPYGLRIGKYYGDQFMVIVQGSTVEILTGDIPASESTASPTLKQVAKFTTPQLVTHADFSPNDSRFFTAEYAGGTMVYDLELSQASQTTFTAAQTRQLEWLNGYHFASTAGGSFYYYDFDGANGQLVAANTLDLPVAMSENSKYLYHFGIVDGKTKLIRTKLTTS